MRYRAQKRGGKGVIGMTAREGESEEDSDFVEHLFTATTHDYLMFFTQSGRCYVERVFEIPEGSRASKGRSIANLLELRSEEKIAATIRIQAQKTRRGNVERKAAHRLCHPERHRQEIESQRFQEHPQRRNHRHQD